ncbi:MAG: type I-D CRISPR-associated helicase Cas3' [Methanosarcinales archaeon]
MKVEKLLFEQIEHPLLKDKGIEFPIYHHQALMLDLWNEKNSFLLTTPTGSGKTASALLPIIFNNESAVFIYPTNALLRNQAKSIVKTLTKKLKKRVEIEEKTIRRTLLEEIKNENEIKEKIVDAYEAEILLYVIDSETLEDKREEKRVKTKGDTLLEIRAEKPTIILTNPDTLFLIISLKYSGKIKHILGLQAFSTLVVDEFHMYSGIELANILYMLKYAEGLRLFNKKIFLSATPQHEIAKMLELFFSPYNITGKEKTNYSVVNNWPVLHEVEVSFNTLSSTFGEEVIDSVLTEIENIKDDLKELRRTRPESDFIPAVIIVDSVVSAIQIENGLINIIGKQKVAPYRGLMSKRERRFKDELVVVGTNAIEVGIDFHCKYLIIAAQNSSSFIQRFGRVGRHEEGFAIVLSPPNVKTTINERFAKVSKKDLIIPREEFEKIINVAYESLDPMIWFVKSKYGALIVELLARKFIKDIKRDTKDQQNIEFIERKLGKIKKDIYALVGQDPKEISKIIRRKRWILKYEEIVSFRSSLPNVIVYDKNEEGKGRFPFYEADIGVILKRGIPATIIKPETLLSKKSTYPEYEKVLNSLYKRCIHNQNPTYLVCVKTYNYKFKPVFEPHWINKVKNKGPHIIGKDCKFVVWREDNINLPVNELLNGHIFMVIDEIENDMTDWRINKFNYRDGAYSGYLVFDSDVLIYKSIAT